MAGNTNSSGGGNAGLAFIVGGIVVVLAIVAWFVFAGAALTPETRDVHVDVNLPDLPDLPDAPTLPEVPRLPQVEPPTVPGRAPSE